MRKIKAIPLVKTSKRIHWGMRIRLANDKLTPLCRGITGLLSNPPHEAADDGSQPDCKHCEAVLSNMIRSDQAERPEGFVLVNTREQTGGRLRKELKKND